MSRISHFSTLGVQVAFVKNGAVMYALIKRSRCCGVSFNLSCFPAEPRVHLLRARRTSSSKVDCVGVGVEECDLWGLGRGSLKIADLLLSGLMEK